MTNEHTGTCIYDKGRFELRETDKAIIDLKGDFPPIMIASNTVDDGSEPNCADKGSVLHLLNELSDNNPNEERHWYLKKMLDKAWTQYHELKEENEQLKSENIELTVDNKELKCSNNELYRENEQLKQTIDNLTSEFEGYHKSLEETKDYEKQFEITSCPYEIRNNKSLDYYWLEHQGNVIGICKVLNEQSYKITELEKENEQLKQQKPFLKIIDDYFIQYEDGELFNLHKPSDIRSLMYILNRGNGYGELECEYNDLGKGDVE